MCFSTPASFAAGGTLSPIGLSFPETRISVSCLAAAVAGGVVLAHLAGRHGRRQPGA